MSFTPEAGTPLAAYYAETQPRTGAVLRGAASARWTP